MNRRSWLTCLTTHCVAYHDVVYFRKQSTSSQLSCPWQKRNGRHGGWRAESHCRYQRDSAADTIYSFAEWSKLSKLGGIHHNKDSSDTVLRTGGHSNQESYFNGSSYANTYSITSRSNHFKINIKPLHVEVDWPTLIYSSCEVQKSGQRYVRWDCQNLETDRCGWCIDSLVRGAPSQEVWIFHNIRIWPWYSNDNFAMGHPFSTLVYPSVPFHESRRMAPSVVLELSI